MPYTYDDEEEDAVAEVLQEGQDLPQMKARGRRRQVMAPKVEVPAGWTPPCIAKTPEEEAFLSGVMMENKLMMSLPPSDRNTLMAALDKQDFAAGAVIIKQGDKGDKFYIVIEGECDISVEGKGSVMKAEKGLSFGELALLHNAPRAATVTALTPVKTFTLDMLSFKGILMTKMEQDQKDYLEFLGSIPGIDGLPPAEKQTLASALKEVVYEAGMEIITEGDVGNEMFIVKEGEVKCTKGGTEVSRRLTRGDFFGELALQSSDRRKATVTATVKTSCLSIHRGAFERVTVKLDDLLAKQASLQERQ